jgi:hypothetical protein
VGWGRRDLDISAEGSGGARYVDMVSDNVGSITAIDGAAGEDSRLKWILVARDDSLESGHQSSSLYHSIHSSLRMSTMATNSLHIDRELVREGHHGTVLTTDLSQRNDYTEKSEE